MTASEDLRGRVHRAFVATPRLKASCTQVSLSRSRRCWVLLGLQAPSFGAALCHAGIQIWGAVRTQESLPHFHESQ